MALNGYRVMDSDMHVMEPADLWQRYIEPRLPRPGAGRHHGLPRRHPPDARRGGHLPLPGGAMEGNDKVVAQCERFGRLEKFREFESRGWDAHTPARSHGRRRHRRRGPVSHPRPLRARQGVRRRRARRRHIARLQRTGWRTSARRTPSASTAPRWCRRRTWRRRCRRPGGPRRSSASRASSCGPTRCAAATGTIPSTTRSGRSARSRASRSASTRARPVVCRSRSVSVSTASTRTSG